MLKIAQLEAQGPSRTCNESRNEGGEEEEEVTRPGSPIAGGGAPGWALARAAPHPLWQPASFLPRQVSLPLSRCLSLSLHLACLPLSHSLSHTHTHTVSLSLSHTHPLRQPAPLLPRQVSPRPFVLSSSFDLLSEACIQGRLDGCLVLRLPLRALPIETEVESAPSQSRSGTSVNLSNDRNPLAVCWDPLSSEYGTHKAIKTRFWRCL